MSNTEFPGQGESVSAGFDNEPQRDPRHDLQHDAQRKAGVEWQGGMWGLAVLSIAALLSYGYYLQYVEYLDPCPLCITQRFFYFLFAACGVVALLLLGSRFWQRLLAFLAALAAIGGIITAGRQVWLQHLPADKVPECGPGLQFWLENMPYLQTLQLLFKGDGNCAEVDWRFLGFSIAEWSLGWFVLGLILAIWLFACKTRIPK